MSDYTLSQTVQISNLPRNYWDILERSDKKGEPVILLRHSKPVGALVAKNVLDELLKIKMLFEEERALSLVKKGNVEYKKGLTVTELP